MLFPTRTKVDSPLCWSMSWMSWERTSASSFDLVPFNTPAARSIVVISLMLSGRFARLNTSLVASCSDHTAPTFDARDGGSDADRVNR